MAAFDAAESLPWTWLPNVLLLGWLGLLGPLLLLLRHLPRNFGSKCQPKDESSGGASFAPPKKTEDAAAPAPAGGPDKKVIVAPRRAPPATVWSSLFNCCTSRGGEVEPATSQAEEPARRPWQAEEVAAAGVPAEVVDDIARLADLVRAGSVEPLSDPLTLWRFYRAREGDVEVAAAMYRESLAWRTRLSIRDVMAAHGNGEDYRPDGGRASDDASSWAWRRDAHTAEAAFIARHGFFGRLQRPAPADGAPVAVWRPGAGDLEGFRREGLTAVLDRGFVAHLEDLLQCGRAASQRRNSVVRCRLIVDASGISMGQSFQRRNLVKGLLALGKAYFPEVNASVTVVRAPKVMAQVWTMVQPLLTPVMRAKVCILGDEFEAGLREHSGLELSALPAFLGGQASDDDICAAVPVPKGAGGALRSALKARR